MTGKRTAKWKWWVRQWEEEEYVVITSSGKRGRSKDSGSNSEKVGSKISQEIAKYRRGKSSSDSKNGLKRNSGGLTLQAQGQGWQPRGWKQASHTKNRKTMILKYWEALREAVRPEICSPPHPQGVLRELRQNLLWEGIDITKGKIEMQRMETRN